MNEKILPIDLNVSGLTDSKINFTKKCKKCNEELDLKFFSVAKRNKDGLKHNCKNCDKKLNHKYYKGHREDKIAKAKDWQIKNREKHFDYQLKYRLNSNQLSEGPCDPQNNN